jgi:hypothetical protein
VSLKKLDLKDSIWDTIHVDEYKAKMGNDEDIIVFSFKSQYKEQAVDLVNFLEKGYDWILDADVSAGELEDGGYLIFVEALRRPSIPNKIIKLLSDIKNLSGIDPEDYRLQYHKEANYVPLTIETITSKVPLDPRKYRKMNKTKDDVDLENMQMAAGLAPKTEEVTDPELKAFVNLSK